MKIKISTSLALVLSVCVVSIRANDLENNIASSLKSKSINDLESIRINTSSQTQSLNDGSQNNSSNIQTLDNLNSKNFDQNNSDSNTSLTPSNTQNDLNSNRSLSTQSQDTLNSKSASSTASKTYQLPLIGVQASKLNAYNLGGGGLVKNLSKLFLLEMEISQVY